MRFATSDLKEEAERPLKELKELTEGPTIRLGSVPNGTEKRETFGLRFWTWAHALLA